MALTGEFAAAWKRLLSPVLCSSCFSDHGLQLEAIKIGQTSRRRCPHCGSRSGAKLHKDDLEPLLIEFFWNGSWLKTEFGGTHRLVSNPMRFGRREVRFPPWLEADAHLLEDKLQVGIFHYGPPLWRLGLVDPLIALQDPSTREPAVNEILTMFPERVLPRRTRFYRIRKNLDEDQEMDPSQYDSPPRTLGRFGRLDTAQLAILYGSESLEICVHECRIVIPDECFVATLCSKRDLRLLDLTSEPDEDGTPFESVALAMRYLFSAEDHSYEITRAIAFGAHRLGFDGISFPSYFSLVKPSRVANIALFGYPIDQGLLELECINRARLKDASYEIRLGPLFT